MLKNDDYHYDSCVMTMFDTHVKCYMNTRDDNRIRYSSIMMILRRDRIRNTIGDELPSPTDIQIPIA